MSRPAREDVLNALLSHIQSAFTASFTATTVRGSQTLLNPSSTTGVFVGFPLAGNGIAEGTTITGLSPLTMSQPALANGAAVALQTGFALVDRRAEFGDNVPAPALFTEVIHLYLAEGLTIGTSDPDADEELELLWLGLDEAIGRVLNGEINDGKTALGLMRARHRLGTVTSSEDPRSAR